ncbi:hypothetical protein XELAEV_18041878mg [Xenopus laevis]|uniref:Helix-turn-helix domain-containing protein n=1 Tax=Xenopus laevis TaxID=8355 RepID=A0A974C366_XENLA|nr:hypothetical protein XELAEV_18041878mg [Xenopus laevis]
MRFIRTLRLKMHFKDLKDIVTTMPIVKKRNTTFDPDITSENRNVFIQMVLHDVENLDWKHLPKKREQHEALCEQAHSVNIRNYYRYVDDIFFTWHGSKEALIDMSKKINTLHPTLKFTLTFHENFHPRSVSKGLPYSQFLRVRWIVSDDQLCHKRMLEMKQRFVERGYPQEGLCQYIEKAMSINRFSLLSDSPKENKERKLQKIPLVSNYNLHSQKIKIIVYKHWEILRNDRQFGNLFRDKPLISYKRARSLGDQLTKTDLTESDNHPPLFFGLPQKGAYPCLSCQCCSSIIKDNKMNHPSKGFEIKLNDFATCNTTGVIYMLKCPCGKAYVGKTKRQVLQVVKFPRQGGDKDRLLLQQEVLWIEKLNTLTPMGLNEELSYSCFY